MSIFISHESALAYWRSYAALERDRIVPTRTKPTKRDIPSAQEVRDLIESGGFGLSEPVHLMVADKESRRKLNSATCHFVAGKLPLRCFAPIGRSCFSCLPEYLFVQLANQCTMIELTEIGYELCGSYTLDTNDLRGFRKRDPLTTAARLKSFAERAEGVRGTKKARRAAKYIADGSASPRETHLAILLSLPCSLGGYGLEKPRMNYRIKNPVKARYSNKPYYLCDLCWPKAKLVIEYDSDQFHTGSDRISADSKRRGDLMLGDILVRTVTNAEIMNAEDMKQVAILVAKHTGKRICKEQLELTWQRIELRNALLHK